MEGDRIDWERLDRFILGEGSPEERAQLEEWMDADPSRRALADAMRGVGAPRHTTAPQWDAPRALHDVRRQLGLSDFATPTIAPPRPRTRRTLARAFLFTGAAAAVVLGVFWRNLSDSQRALVPAQVWATAWTR